MATKVKLIADNVITTDQIDLTSINTDNLSEGSTNLYFTNARVDSRLSGGTGVTYSSGEISIGQSVATDSNVTFADLTVTGDLNITGDINSYNVTDLDVTDQTITLGAGQIEANSGGSGIIVAGSNASILWDETNDTFDINKGLNVDSNTFVVDNINNRVGIGTESPQNTLHVSSTLAQSNGIRITNSEGSFETRVDQGAFYLYDVDDNRIPFYINTSGNVGIGTTDPGHPLNVVNSGELQAEFSGYSHASAANNSRAGSGSIRLGNGAGTTGLLIDYTDQGQTIGLIKNEYVATVDSELRLQSPFVSFYTGTSATENMRIDASGDVQIGGVNHQGLSGSARELTIGTTGDTANDGGGISFTHNSVLGSYILGQKQALTIAHYTDGSDIIFRTNNGGVNADRFRITSTGKTQILHGGTTYYTSFEGNNEINLYTTAGASSTLYVQHSGGDLNIGDGGLYWDRSASSVGIGETTPLTELHVKGTNNSAGDLWTAVGSGNVPSITIQNAGTTDNNNAAIFFRNDSGMFASVGARFVNHTTDETELRFSTTNSSGTTRERVIIDGSGNVGIGTTAVTSPGLWYDGVNDYLAISHWATPPTPAAMLHLSDNSNDLNVPQIRIEGRENPGDTKLDISVKDSAVRFNLIEGGTDASVGYGQMIFKTDAAANTGAPTRGGFLFETPADSSNLIITNTGKIGIGTIPQTKFDVETSSNSFVSVGVAQMPVGAWAGIHFGYKENNNSYRKSAIVFKRTDLTSADAQGQVHFLNGPQNSSNNATLSDSRMIIHEGGQVTSAYNPAFRAYLSTEQTANGAVTSGYTDNDTTASRAYDRNGDFNISNGRFTAPVDGVYVFSIMWDSLNQTAGFNLNINGTAHVQWEPTGLGNAAWESRHYSTHAKLAKNDYVQLVIVHSSGSGNPVHQGGGTWGHFAGALIS